MAQCYFCGTIITDKTVYRTSVCSRCGRDLKICRNCRFYSPGSPYDCRESISEQVRDKEKANFCDFFSPAENNDSRDAGKHQSAKSAFDSLFSDDD